MSMGIAARPPRAALLPPPSVPRSR
uniref:Erythromycin resistance leader peptide n=1 Tax=Streptomyces fradiae TaxID=1906 RepID=LPER_STRFR|nr:RecName: Full=Erythromycin resistance leader peptide; AltName: Full=23S rRNA methylase leader peptide [Streptomyces fradiae]AAA26741.1 'leader peptide' (put.); putative [Streptomyces fradiae]